MFYLEYPPVPNAENENDFHECNIFVPSYPFTPLDLYNIRIQEIFQESNVAREAQRKLSRVFNEMLQDVTLGKKKKNQKQLDHF